MAKGCVRRWAGWAGSALAPEATTGLPTGNDGLPVTPATSRTTNGGGNLVVGVLYRQFGPAAQTSVLASDGLGKVYLLMLYIQILPPCPLLNP